MLTQVEMAQIIIDQGGNCTSPRSVRCNECPIQKYCDGTSSDVPENEYLAGFVGRARAFLRGYGVITARRFPEHPPKSHLNTKTRRKPAFKRLSSRKTYQPEGQICLSRYFSPRQDKFV